MPEQPCDERDQNPNEPQQPSSWPGSFGLGVHGARGVIHPDALLRTGSNVSQPLESPIEVRIEWSAKSTRSAAELLRKLLRVEVVTTTELGANTSIDLHVFAVGILLGTLKFHIVHRRS